MPGDFPAHASPVLAPQAFPRPSTNTRTISHSDLHKHGLDSTASPSAAAEEQLPGTTPPPLVSPKLSPPTTPSGTAVLPAPTTDLTDPSSSASETSAPPPALLEKLPEVSCEVRARIPTTAGQEMFLHLYHNSADNKEHLAIVFGPHIRSRSLDAPRPGETEKDRMIRGAYGGTLYPGRTSSRIEQIRREAGLAPKPPAPSASSSPLHAHDDSSHGATEREASTDQYHEYERPSAAPLVRIHSECYTGETVWSARCDCGEQLDEAARLMSLDPSGGVIIYLRQEGRGIGLLSKLKAYNLQDLGHDTMQANLLLRHPADARSYGLATAMLMDLDLGGERGIRLLTNNPEKVRAVEGPGREVVVKERVAMIPLAWSSGGEKGVHGPEVEKYISTKIEKFKHMFSS